MKTMTITRHVVTALLAVAIFAAGSWVTTAQSQPPAEERLVVLWRSGDPELFHQACYTFTLNAKRFRWFQEVTVYVWGPAEKLLLEDVEIQAKIAKMRKAGVEVIAEIDPAIEYDIELPLRKVVPVTILSQRLVEHLKSGARILTI
jgi:hypothetical protein